MSRAGDDGDAGQGRQRKVRLAINPFNPHLLFFHPPNQTSQPITSTHLFHLQSPSPLSPPPPSSSSGRTGGRRLQQVPFNMIFARDPYVRARKEYRGGWDALLSQTIALRPAPSHKSPNVYIIAGESSLHGENSNSEGSSVQGESRLYGENSMPPHWGVVEVHRDPLTGNWLIRFGDANHPLPTEESSQVRNESTTIPYISVCTHPLNNSLPTPNLPLLYPPLLSFSISTWIVL